MGKFFSPSLFGLIRFVRSHWPLFPHKWVFDKFIRAKPVAEASIYGSKQILEFGLPQLPASCVIFLKVSFLKRNNNMNRLRSHQKRLCEWYCLSISGAMDMLRNTFLRCRSCDTEVFSVWLTRLLLVYFCFHFHLSLHSLPLTDAF